MRYKRRYERRTPRQPVYTYHVTDNGSLASAAARSEAAAEAMAICAARYTGYGAFSIRVDGDVKHVQRYRCDATGDGHVYTWRYDPNRYQDVPVVVCEQGAVLP